jgi:hypothetical protein
MAPRVLPVLEMKRRAPNTQFLTALAAVNVLALLYPTSLLLHAKNAYENLLATVALIGFVFALAVVDAISILVADVLDIRKR